MFAEFRLLDGPAAGETRVVKQEFATIGRHPSADIVFDADRDLDVSGRHAAVFRQGKEWVLRDLGSTNGTWVNDTRIKGDRTLAAEDVIRFGANGPRLAFRAHAGEPPTVPATRPSPAPMPRSRPGPPAETTRVRAAVRRETRTWKRVTLSVSGVAIVALLGATGLAWKKSREFEALRGALLARTDSALTRLTNTTTTVAALRAALDSARDDTQRLRAQVAAGRGGANQLAILSSDVALRLARQQAVVRVAEFDAAEIARSNADAIAMVVVEFGTGRRVAGTGFSVRVRGDTGWIATVRHLVVDSLGRPPRRLGVIFNGSNQNFRADLVARSDSADLALLAVRIRGGMPAIRALGGAVRPGDPVAILGFPYGLDFPFGGDWRTLGVSVSSFAGSLSAMNRVRLEVNGFGATGSSGSPLFNAAGEVVGVLFGGDPASAGGTVYATPVAALEALLASLPTRG